MYLRHLDRLLTTLSSLAAANRTQEDARNIQMFEQQIARVELLDDRDVAFVRVVARELLS